MTTARIYQLRAAAGKQADVAAALCALARAMPAIEGCEGADVLQDAGDELHFTLFQRWSSAEAHQKGVASFDMKVVAELLAALDGPLDGAYFKYIPQS